MKLKELMERFFYPPVCFVCREPLPFFSKLPFICSKCTPLDNLIKVREGHEGINNLITIYSAITKKSNEEIEAEFEGKGYGDFKAAVAEVIIEELKPIQQRYDELIKDKAYIEEIYTNGAKIAQSLARRTLSKVHRRVGFVDRKN